MLPVFSRPLGFRKLNLVTESTEYERIASARLVLLEFGLLLAGTPLTPEDTAGADETDPGFRIRSAHDFGATLAGGDIFGWDSGDSGEPSGTGSPMRVVELSVPDEGEVSIIFGLNFWEPGACELEVDFGVVVACVLGMTGTTGRVTVLLWECVGVWTD